jgi:hypothetical protein
LEFAFHTQLRAHELEKEVTPEHAVSMFQAAVGAAIDVDILSRGTWIAGYALVAERFQAGRVFLAGDAAHLFTPAGGLGYNTAVEDAVNLGWKLAAIVRGQAGPGLLASYELERQPIAYRNTRFARAFADSIGLYEPVPEIEDDTAADENARRAAGAYLGAHGKAEFDIPGITFGARYDQSPIIISDGAAPPSDAANVYVPSACPGGRAPQGNRVKKLCSDETCEKVVIPSGDFAAEAQGIFTGGSSDQVEGDVLDGGEVGRGVIGANAAFIVTEHHVHDPMKAVLNHPVGANSRSKQAGDPQQ